jgi:hypothetical protein
MNVNATTNDTLHRGTCGRDGAACPTGEHGWCPGCRSEREVPVAAPIAEHDDGCPAVDHCPGCAADSVGRGHRRDCACAYADHRVPGAVMAEVYDEAETRYIAWGAETLAAAAQSGTRLLREELRDAVHAAGRHSIPSGRRLMRALDQEGAAGAPLHVELGFRVWIAPAGAGYRVLLADSDSRMTEPAFRRGRPHQVDGIEILEVSRFDGGSFERGTYALAAALTRSNGDYSTHTLIYQDEVGRWLLSHGHYEIASRDEAKADARTRALI